MLKIICALHCEAKPLIDLLSLKSDTTCSLFPLYRNETTELVISGIGKVAAASATGYLLSRCQKGEVPAWLNVGIGGHRKEAIGKGYLINKIIDRATQNRYYPGIAVMPKLPTAILLTVERPETDYPNEGIVDMEGSGFFPTACRLSPVELIQCYKIISDNQERSTAEINKTLVSDLVTAKTNEIQRIIEALHSLTTPSKHSLGLQLFLEGWHFTESQRVLLENLVRRWSALCGDRPLLDSTLENLTHSKQVLSALEEKINSQPLSF